MSSNLLFIRILSEVLKGMNFSFLRFPFRKILFFFERKKMGFSLSALQFGKELLEVKGETEKKEFC